MHIRYNERDIDDIAFANKFWFIATIIVENQLLMWFYGQILWYDELFITAISFNKPFYLVRHNTCLSNEYTNWIYTI